MGVRAWNRKERAKAWILAELAVYPAGQTKDFFARYTPTSGAATLRALRELVDEGKVLRRVLRRVSLYMLKGNPTL